MSENEPNEPETSTGDLSQLDEALLVSSEMRASADRAAELGEHEPTVEEYGHEAIVDSLSELVQVAGDMAPIMRGVADDMENRARTRYDAPPAPGSEPRGRGGEALGGDYG